MVMLIVIVAGTTAVIVIVFVITIIIEITIRMINTDTNTDSTGTVAGETAPERVLCLLVESCKIWAYGGEVSHLLQKQQETLRLVVKSRKMWVFRGGSIYIYMCIYIYIYAQLHVHMHIHTNVSIWRSSCRCAQPCKLQRGSTSATPTLPATLRPLCARRNHCSTRPGSCSK